MIKKIHLLLGLFLSFNILIAQTPGPGSLAFIAFQSDAPDGFAVVLLQDFPGNQVIYFTDKGWSGTALFANENLLQWTLPTSGLNAGTTVQFRNLDNINTLITPIGAGTAVDAMPSISASGDQIFAFSGSLENPSFIAGISSSDWLEVCNTTGTGTTNSTCLPAPLVNGVNAFAFTNTSAPVSNGFFNIGVFNGSASDLRAMIYNVENWVINGDIAVAGYTEWPVWNFNLGSVINNATIQFETASNTINTTADPFLVNLIIFPDAIASSEITISYTLSSGISNNDFEINQNVVSNSFTIPVNMGVSNVNFLFSIDNDLELTTNESITFSISNSSDDNLLIGDQSLYTLTINPTPGSETPVLFINEIMAQNAATIADEFGEYDDWIEIYNPNNFEVDLAGLYITDNLGLPTKYMFPFGSELTIIPANGFKLIWADNEPIDQGVLHTNFALSMNGEAVGLYAPDGVTAIDSITFGVQQTDLSYGRQTDGNAPWVFFNTPTPGASNNSTSVNHLSQVSSWNVFPNPAKEMLNVFWTGELMQNVQISIYDMYGRNVISQVYQNVYPNSGFRINTMSLSDGFYKVVFQQEKHLSSKSVFVYNR